jgi:hypothetical protein
MNVIEQAQEIRAAMDDAVMGMSKAKLKKCAALVKPWKSKTIYAVDEIVRHGNTLYKCNVPHTSDRPPTAESSEWTQI